MLVSTLKCQLGPVCFYFGLCLSLIGGEFRHSPFRVQWLFWPNPVALASARGAQHKDLINLHDMRQTQTQHDSIELLLLFLLSLSSNFSSGLERLCPEMSDSSRIHNALLWLLSVNTTQRYPLQNCMVCCHLRLGMNNLWSSIMSIWLSILGS